jgi:cysteine-rich repeat protein
MTRSGSVLIRAATLWAAALSSAATLGIAGCNCRGNGECGDGVVNTDNAENCDDGNATSGDGCDSICTVEAGFMCTGQPSVCTMSGTCGDASCDVSEDCTSCPSDCGACPGTCGDGALDAGEDCDDMGESATCNADCTTAACGDSIVNATAGEECDDGNTTDGDGCSSLCGTEPASCGDGTCDLAGTETCTNCPADCAADPACVEVLCGDNVVAPGEECDGTDLAGQDCVTQGFDGGTLGCSAGCTYDTNGCFSCGDGTANGTEECDGTDLGGSACSDLGFFGGALGCSATCTFDVTACNDCGDGFVDPGEDCDGTDLGGQTCTDIGFGGGTLACAASCTFDTAGCNPCGNNVADPGETCDGVDLAGQDCVTQGFGSGALACNATCDAFVTAGCNPCGNNVIDVPEQCDGTDLGGLTCVSLGFTGGTLACTATCTQDSSGCSTCGNGVIEGTETCDDGNTTAGDGCDAACAAEPGEYEVFLGGAADSNDLCGSTLQFNWNGTSYDFPNTIDGVDVFPTTPGTGAVASTALTLTDDGTSLVTLTTGFNFFGVARTTMNVNSNGNITFGGGSADFTETVPEMYAAGLARAAVFWDDFNPARGGFVTVDEFVDRVVVTWEEILPFAAANILRNSFQATFYTNDTIEFTYLNLGETDGLVGLADGGGAAAPPEDDFWTGTRSEGFHELFTAGHDLTNTRMLFVATPSLNGFVPETLATGIGGFPDAPGTGTTTAVLTLGDDATTVVTFPVTQTFTMFGVVYSAMNVNSNGNITFGAGDTTFDESVAEHYLLPRISVFWDDLNPSAGGTVRYDAFADRITVTWTSVPLFGAASTDSVQVTMFTSGANVGNVRMTYLGVASTTGLVGISSGTGTAPKCPLIRSDVNRESDGVFELWTGGADSFDLANNQITFIPDPFAGGGFTFSETATGLAAYPTAVGTGTVQTLTVGPVAGASDCDDCSTAVDLLGFRFPFYENRYSRMFVGSNGYITFGRGDADFDETVNDHLSPEPRISVFFDDLLTSLAGAGSVVLDEFADRVVLTWDGVAVFGAATPVVFVQAELFNDGRIRISYLGNSQTDGLMGVSMGGRIPAVVIPEVNFE